MRVLIFGAGASKRAGYPLANELLDRVGESASESSSIQFRDAWQAWESFRESVPASLRLIAYNSNPEVVLSLPDLYHLAVESEDDQQLSPKSIDLSSIRAHRCVSVSNGHSPRIAWIC